MRTGILLVFMRRSIILVMLTTGVNTPPSSDLRLPTSDLRLPTAGLS